MEKETPYEYHDNKLGVKLKYLIADRNKHEDSLCLFQYRTLRKRLDSKSSCEQELRRACFGQEALVAFDSLDRETKEALVFKFGEPNNEVKKNWFASQYTPDRNAFDFYLQYRYGAEKKRLKDKYITEYVYNASVLNAVLQCQTNRKEYIKAQGARDIDIWQSLSNDVNAFKEVAHNLPPTKDSLRRKASQYKKQGYIALISGKLTTQNAIKRNKKLEALIISLYCLPTKPYVETVFEMYKEFMAGHIEVANINTGEMYEPKQFYKKGEPIELSVGTIWNIVSDPDYQVIINKYRNGAYDFNQKVRPHVNRYAPTFSMSKISLDDRDIMHTKLPDGSKVMAYYAFDVMSGAMIGIAHSKSKTHELYLDCLRNMFQFISSKGIGMPLEMEVEQHLVSDFKDDLMKAGEVFPFVRFCNPTNSQEKYAERMIGSKKYGVEKSNNQNVGRHYSKLDSNRTTIQKIYDEHNDTYKIARASYDTIVANELQEQIQYNNQLHSNQKLYKGKTRMQVFLENIHPNLPRFDMSYLARFIGIKTETSIRRSQYVTVKYNKYQLESPRVLRPLSS